MLHCYACPLNLTVFDYDYRLKASVNCVTCDFYIYSRLKINAPMSWAKFTFVTRDEKKNNRLRRVSASAKDFDVTCIIKF